MRMRMRMKIMKIMKIMKKIMKKSS